MIILITGITSGFGEAMARQLCAAGHTVYGTHRNAKDFIPGVTYIKADVQDEAQWLPPFSRWLTPRAA